MRRSRLPVVMLLLITSCAAEPTESSSITAQPATSTTTQPPSSTTSTAALETTMTLEPTTTSTTPEIDVEISQGEVTGRERFEYQRGETVSISVLADAAYELHVHGYDLRYELEPGVLRTIEFTADVPGIFEVETHPGHLVLFEIEVAG